MRFPGSGIQGGSENGHYGYMMTYCVAYMRVSACECHMTKMATTEYPPFSQDLGFDYCFVAESFETSVPWDR